MTNILSKITFKSKMAKVLASAGVMMMLTACPSPNNGPTANLDAPIKIALLVPTGGSNAQIGMIGKSIEAAAKMAVAEHNNGDIELMVLPTGGNEAQAVAQANKARAAGALLILGPLKSTEALSVANAVSDIPIWTFSNNNEVDLPNTYLLGTSFDVIATRVAKYAKSQGVKSMGIIATDDIGGDQGMIASRDAAVKSRMAVVYAAKYPLSQDGIKANAPGIAAALKASGAQSVMFTDTPNGGLGLMTNALADQGYTSASSQFLGLSRWDDRAEFLQEANLDKGYFAAPDPAKSRAFAERFNAKTGQETYNLAGLGYDGVAAVIELVKRAKSKGDTTPFGDNDIMRSGFDGVMGAFKFNDEHHADRALAVFQVNGSGAKIVSGAPGSM